MTAFRRALCATLALALLAPFAALAAKATTKTYKGRTNGGEAVTVKVKNGRMTSFKGSVHASCGTANLLITVAYPPSGAKKGTSAPIRKHAFKVTYRSDPTLDPEDDKRTLAGTFAKNGKLTGTIKIRGLCTADASYSAKRG